ncbi:hypothetical protein ACLM5H_18520 [Fredinandcohnia humi]
MTYQFLELDETYNQQLLVLSRTTNTGSDLFYVDRSPNFFKLSEELGETRQFGLFSDGELIGSVAVSMHKRIVDGECTNAYYLNDLRVHPNYQRTYAYYRLTKNLLDLYVKEGNVKWMFSTILDSNQNQATIIKGTKILPRGKELGRTVHIGVPLFLKQPKSNYEVSELNGENAWKIYKKLMNAKKFALCDKHVFLRDNGLFLVIKDKQEPLAFCKLVDQSNARKLRLARKLPFSFIVINLFCRVAGCPSLPSKEKEFLHSYVSYYAAKDSNQKYLSDFISYIQRQYKQKYSYVFFGVSAKGAIFWERKLFHIKLTSTTYGYGDIPGNLSMDSHELTLI